MRIAFFSDNFYPELSGITDTILITGAELKKRGHEIVYVAPRYVKRNYDAAHRPFPTEQTKELVEGMPAIRLPSFHLPYSPTGESRFAIPTGASFKALAEFKPDIIHTQSPYTTGWEAVRAAKHFNVPLLGTNHTAIEDFFPMGAIMRRFDAWYYNHCSFVSAPYEGLVSRMREAGFSKPGHAVRNPAELSRFTAPTQDEKSEAKQSLGIDGPVMLYCGRLGVEKRVDVLVRALPEIKKEFPKIILVATGHGAALDSLKALAIELRVEANVRFTGFLSRDALSHVYKASDLFTFMSTSDSQSLALMQGYAAGLPALCARARGLPDYTPESCGVLIEPGNHRALATEVTRLLKDENLRSEMGRAAVEYAKDFAPEKIADEWEKIYEQYKK